VVQLLDERLRSGIALAMDARESRVSIDLLGAPFEDADDQSVSPLVRWRSGREPRVTPIHPVVGVEDGLSNLELAFWHTVSDATASREQDSTGR